MSDTDTEVQQAMQAVIASGQVPGVVVAMARGSERPTILALGNDASGTPLTAESIFPVASVTKMATALVVHRLVADGRWHLDDLLSDYLPQAAGAQSGVTLRTLLSHTSGLPLDVAETDAPYGPELDWATLSAACLLTPLEAEPCTRVQYSNVGYGLLAIAAEVLTGEGFAALLEEQVLRPRNIAAYLGSTPPRPTVQLARVRSSFAGTELEPYNTAFWRNLALPWGGLFTTAAGALAIVQSFRDEAFLPAAVRAAAVADSTGGLAGGFVPPLMWNPCPWALGPEVRGAKEPHWVSQRAAAASFGHSGASGCLAWCDPVADLAFSIHGARPADSGWLLRRAPTIADAIYDWAGAA